MLLLVLAWVSVLFEHAFTMLFALSLPLFFAILLLLPLLLFGVFCSLGHIGCIGIHSSASCVSALVFPALRPSPRVLLLLYFYFHWQWYPCLLCRISLYAVVLLSMDSLACTLVRCLSLWFWCGWFRLLRGSAVAAACIHRFARGPKPSYPWRRGRTALFPSVSPDFFGRSDARCSLLP